MSTLEKKKQRLISEPSDYTYLEAKSLLTQLGYQEDNKGLTSGSRVRFFRQSDGDVITLHKPHPGKILKIYAVRMLKEKLEGNGDLWIWEMWLSIKDIILK